MGYQSVDPARRGGGRCDDEVLQTYQRMVSAPRLFYDLLLAGRFWHDGDPTLAVHLRQCHARRGARTVSACVR